MDEVEGSRRGSVLPGVSVTRLSPIMGLRAPPRAGRGTTPSTAGDGQVECFTKGQAVGGSRVHVWWCVWLGLIMADKTSPTVAVGGRGRKL